MRRALVIGLATAGAVTAMSGSAEASFPGTNGLIAFGREFSAPIGGVYAVQPDGQNQFQLTSEDVPPDFNPTPSFSADGERIAFSRLIGADTEIFVMDAGGQNQVQLTDNSVEDLSPSFSPDGQRIVFTSRTATGGDAEIVLMGADGQNPVELTNNSQNDLTPSFSPDGRTILFARDLGGDREIFTMDPDGQNEANLTQSPAFDLTPSFSPDGQSIAFARDVGAGNREIFVMGLNGGTPTPVTTNPANDLYPSFSPDGQRIAFTRFESGNGEIFVMDANGQNEVRIVAGSASDFSTSWQPLNPPVCELSGQAKQKSSKQVTVTITCSEDVAANVAGSLKAPKAPKLGAAGSKSKTVSLLPQTLEVQPGTPTNVTLKPSNRGRRLLKRALKAGKKPKGSVTITATDDLALSAQDSFAVKLKPMKK